MRTCANCEKDFYSKLIECPNMLCMAVFCSEKCKEEHIKEVHPPKTWVD